MKPSWEIAQERKQSEDFAIRAMILEEMGLTNAAEMFRKLISLNDSKIEIYKELSETTAIFKLYGVEL